MELNIIAELIGGLCVAVPTVIATIVANNKSRALMEYRIDQLDKKVEKHNNVIERTFHLEEEVHVLEEKVRGYHHE